MIRCLLLGAITMTAVGCEQRRDGQTTGYYCEQKAIEAAGDRPITAVLNHYPTADLVATIAECPQSELSVKFANREERLLFLGRHRDRTELPIVDKVRFSVVGFDPQTASIEVEKIQFLNGH